MKLLALVLLLSTFSSLILTEVVKHFEKSKCSKFFIRTPKGSKIITPTVFEESQYKKICQSWKNRYTFATLYDTKRRIPVYSAYTFTGGEEHNPRNNKWKNEPQLENNNGPPDMELLEEKMMDKFTHQAVDRDYKDNNNIFSNTEYTRGHVYPRQYAGDENQAESTFTFTNVAPQTKHSNGEWEREVETPMMNEIGRVCRPNNNKLTYIVTGVVPGNKWIQITRKVKDKSQKIDEGVNIPSYYWTAFCCAENGETISGAYLVRQNEPNQNTYERSRMSVDRLNAQLTRLYEKNFNVFGTFCLN